MPAKVQPIEPGADEFHEVEYVQRDLKVTRSTLNTWASQRRGPPFVKVGRRRCYPALDYKRWKATLPRVVAA